MQVFFFYMKQQYLVQLQTTGCELNVLNHNTTEEWATRI